jgi:hypothetical protein
MQCEPVGQQAPVGQSIPVGQHVPVGLLLQVKQLCPVGILQEVGQTRPVGALHAAGFIFPVVSASVHVAHALPISARDINVPKIKIRLLFMIPPRVDLYNRLVHMQA